MVKRLIIVQKIILGNRSSNSNRDKDEKLESKLYDANDAGYAEKSHVNDTGRCGGGRRRFSPRPSVKRSAKEEPFQSLFTYPASTFVTRYLRHHLWWREAHKMVGSLESRLV